MNACPDFFLGTEAHLSAVNERLRMALAISMQIAFDWRIESDTICFCGAWLSEHFTSLPLDSNGCCTSADFLSIVHEDDRGALAQYITRSLRHSAAAEDVHRAEVRIRNAAKEWRWVDIGGKIVERDAQQRPLRVVGSIRDIDERKQAENKLLRLRDLYMALSQTNQAIVRIKDRPALFQEICRIAVEYGHFGMAWIGLADRASSAVVPVAAYGAGFDAAPDAFFAASCEISQSAQSVDNTDGARDRRAMFQSSASFPFFHRGRLFGALNLYTAEKDFFDESLIGLIEEMTRDISFAIDNYEREEEREEIKGELIESAMRYRQLVELSPEAILVYCGNSLTLANRAAAAMLGAGDPNDLIGRPVSDFIIDRQIWQRIDGTRFHAEVSASVLTYDGKPATHMVVRDVTARKRAEELQLGQNRILNMVATGVELRTILREIALFIEAQSNRGLCSILLLDSGGKTLSNGASPSLPDSYHRELNGVLVTPASGSCGTAIFRAEPVVVTDIASDPLWSSSRELALRHGLKACSSWPIFGKNRKMLGTVALYFHEPIAPTPQELQLFSICTNLAGIAIESRASEERIRYLAHYDGLTSLPNRFLFKEFLDLALRNAQRHGTKFAVFFIDLDKFKDINDTFGHEAGDHVLRETAARLRGCLRQTDKIARMGGDEFYILIEDMEDGCYASEVAQKLVEEASQPIAIDGHPCRISVSIGIGIYPDDGENGTALLRNADQAMYRAKNLGKNGFQFFSGDAQPIVIPSRVGFLPLRNDARYASGAMREQPPVI